MSSSSRLAQIGAAAATWAAVGAGRARAIDAYADCGAERQQHDGRDGDWARAGVLALERPPARSAGPTASRAPPPASTSSAAGLTFASRNAIFAAREG
jgi:hypothetical protein